MGEPATRTATESLRTSPSVLEESLRTRADRSESDAGAVYEWVAYTPLWLNQPRMSRIVRLVRS